MAALATLSLEHVPLFRGLAPDALAHLERAAHVRRIAPGEVILTGDGAHDVYIVLAGVIEILCTKDTAGSLVLAELRVGECFGEFAAIDGKFGSAQARAADWTTLLEIPRMTFVRILREDPILAFRLLEHLVGRIRELNQRLAGLYELRDDIQRIHLDLFLTTL